jgi:hypothetical protein
MCLRYGTYLSTPARHTVDAIDLLQYTVPCQPRLALDGRIPDQKSRLGVNSYSHDWSSGLILHLSSSFALLLHV